MKINEITEAPEMLARLVKGAKAAVKGYTQSRDIRVNAQATAQMAQMAARAWGKMKQNLERVNDYKPLTTKQQTDQLTDWIDNNLLGSYSLQSASGTFKSKVRNLVNTIIDYPEKTQASFNELLTSASKLALDPKSKIDNTRDQPGQTAGTNTAPFKVVGNIATAGNMELNLKDPQQLELYNKFRDEWNQDKGIIKV
jgi:phage terminase small subunit